MTPERWARIGDIFGEAMDLSGNDQAEYVRRACQDDDSLRDEILRLLKDHQRPGLFVDRPLLPEGILSQAAESRTFRDGQLVSGRFRITGFIGEGGMGEVYSAEDEELRSPVAIKTLRPHFAGSAKFAERFRHEIQFARKVTHPNVCRVFDAGRHEQTLYFTMELLDGETLARRIERDGRIQLDKALPIVRQLCEGLSAAHRAGILHRDFKSANVMMEGSRAVITDFGLARLLEAGATGGASTGVAIGTPAYMAPEQIEGQPAGPAADIYALGVVLYEMVTGRRPHIASSPLALAAMKVKNPPPPPSGFAPEITPVWESVILKCLAAKPDGRFIDALQVVEAIDRARPLHIPFQLPPLKRMGIAAAVAIVAIGGGFGVRRLIQGGPPHAPTAEAVRWYLQGRDAMGENAFLKASNLLERVISLDDSYVAAHARLAEAYAELDMGDKAKDEVIHAATLVPNRSNLQSETALLLEAAQFTVGREFVKAVPKWQAIVSGAPASEKGRAYLDLGRAAEKANLIKEAADAFQRASAASPQREAALLHLGMLSARKGDAKLAATQFAEAEQLFRLTSNFEGVTEVKLALARMHESSGLADAETNARAALEMTGLTRNLQQQIKARFQLSRIKLLQGHSNEARTIADEGVGLAGRNRLDNLSVQGLNDVAAVLTRQLHWIEVEDWSRRAIELARRSMSRGGEARALFFLGNARMELSDNDGALQYLRQAVPYYREGGYSQQLQNLLAIEADVLCNRGRYGEAKKNAAELIHWAESRDDAQTLIPALQRAAEPLAFEGSYSAALGLYERAAIVARKSGREVGTAYASINQADMLWRLGRYTESDARLADAQAILKKLGEDGRGPAVRLDTIQAESMLSRLQPAAAKAKASVALRAAKGGAALRVVDAQAVLAVALARLGEFGAGREMCAQLLRTAERSGHLAGISIAKLAAAESLRLAGDPHAVTAIKDARDHCLRSGHRELAFRALLIQWNLERKTGAASELAASFERESAELEKLWGPGSLAIYLRRPDIRSLIPAGN